MRKPVVGDTAGKFPGMISVTKLLCGAPAHDQSDGGESGSRSSDMVWNITRRCNLRCPQCDSDSSNKPCSGELTLGEMVAVVDDLADSGIRNLLFSGGEPLLHPHFFDVAGYAAERGMRVSVFSNGTRLDSHAAAHLKDLGVGYVELSLDGLGEESDAYRGRTGTFKKTVTALRSCRGTGQKVGLRIPISRRNAARLPEILSFIEEEEVPTVSFYHPVFPARGAELARLPATETRNVLRMILDAVLRWNRAGVAREVFTANQPADTIFYWLRMKRRNPKRAGEIWASLLRMENKPKNSGLGTPGIDSQGNVRPNLYWDTHSFGNVKESPFRTIWETSKQDAMLNELREAACHLKGRCGHCRFQSFCGGGSRVRALKTFGSLRAEDPGCHLRDYEIA